MTVTAGHATRMLVGYVLDPPRDDVVAMVDGRIQRDFDTAASVRRDGRSEPDADILEGAVDRNEGPIRLPHLYVDMHA